MIWAIIIALLLTLSLVLILCGLRPIIKLFENGSVFVTGEKGSGKDVLFGNVIARRKKDYVSNIDYSDGVGFHELNLCDLDCGGNDYRNFINNSFNQYVYKYPKGADVYISDVGNYLPAQYNGELNKRYPYFPGYFSLSRQISRNRIHVNCQRFMRVWDKLREQSSDRYINCNWCRFFGPLVVMKVTLYDKAESCQNRVRPCAVRKPLFMDREKRMQVDMYLDNFYNTHGDVRSRILVFFNRSKHDTYLFEKKLKVVYSYEDSFEDS